MHHCGQLGHTDTGRQDPNVAYTAHYDSDNCEGKITHMETTNRCQCDGSGGGAGKGGYSSKTFRGGRGGGLGANGGGMFLGGGDKMAGGGDARTVSLTWYTRTAVKPESDIEPFNVFSKAMSLYLNMFIIV